MSAEPVFDLSPTSCNVASQICALLRFCNCTIILGPPDPYGLAGLVQTIYAYYFTVRTSDWQLPDAPLPLTLGPQDLFAALRPLEATSWAEVPLAL